MSGAMSGEYARVLQDIPVKIYYNVFCVGNNVLSGVVMQQFHRIASIWAFLFQFLTQAD